MRREEDADAEERRFASEWKRLMNVSLDDFLGEGSISVYGPWAYLDMVRFPLKMYRAEGKDRAFAVMRYDYPKYELEAGPGVPLRTGVNNPNEAYAAAYDAARAFGEQYADEMGVALKDNCKRRP